MPPSQTTVLTVLLAVTLVAAAVLLGAVFATVFFAVTVAYLLVPLHRRVKRLGLPMWWASATTAILATLAVVVPVSIGVFLATGRIGQLVEVLRRLPETVSLTVYDYTYVADIGVITNSVLSTITAFAVDVVGALPELALKLTLFGMVVFGLLLAHEDAERALLATIPESYHDIARALGERATDILYAIYVLQAATALATAVIALPVFFVLDVPYPITLAIAAGLLQFVPIVGPSIVIAGIAVYQASTGDTTGAVAVLLVAGVLVAWLPDVLVRPRLSRQTADLPGSLYFVGFTGGLLTVGPIGIIAGPLIVALVVEVAGLLADEHRDTRQSVTVEDGP